MNTSALSLEQLVLNTVTQFFNIQHPDKNVAQFLQIQRTRREFEGEFTLVVFPLTKIFGQNPEALGNQLGIELIAFSSFFTKFNVVKGFLNLSLDVSAIKNIVNNCLSIENFGVETENQGKVLIEFSSPNTNKPIHLGHMRNNFLGDSLSKIMSYAGYNVSKVNLVNDRGIHICKSMAAYMLYGNGATPASVGKKGDHFVGDYYVMFNNIHKQEIAQLIESGISEDEASEKSAIMKLARKLLIDWENKDPETISLWQTMNQWVLDGFKATYDATGISFDKFYFESQTYLLGKDIIEEGLKKGVFYREADNSVWIDLTEEGLDKKVLLRGDGTSVYITQDLGTADLKYSDYQADRSIYVVGNEQNYHFQVLFKILEKLNRTYAKGMHHLSYGMVELPSGKMKSREGTVVDADDLWDEMITTAKAKTMELGKIDGLLESESEILFKQLAMGALRFFLLKVDPKKKMLFSPEESVDFQGFTGPFVQYTHARIVSLLQKSGKTNFSVDNEYQPNDIEKALLLLIDEFPAIVKRSANEYNPSIVAQYAFDLAKEFNRFYSELKIATEPQIQARDFRLAISAAIGKTIKIALALLGIESPNRM